MLSPGRAPFGEPVRMDWDAIDDEMYKVAPEFKDPRFDSLRLVLSIVGSVNAEAKVEELRSQRERVEDLVDDVVQAYHNGFNKAIHNYSRILHLFSESKEQVEKLRICLEEARRRLGAQSRSLQQQWRRGITLGDTVRLLGDVNSISDAPQRVQKLEEAKDWETAVDVLLEACNKLARRELDNVGALRDMKRDMALRRNSLHKQLVHELEDRVFVSMGNPKGTSGNPDDPEGDEDDSRSLSNSLIRSDSLLALIASQNKSKDVAATPRGRDALLLSASSNNFSTGSSGTKGLERSASLLARTAALKLAESKPLPPLPMAKVVDCLVKLGGIAEAQLTLRRHMPTQVRNVILRALQQSQIDKAAAAVGTHAAAARAAQMAVECVFDHCLQMLRSLIEVLKLLNGARPSASSAGLELLLAARSTDDVSLQLPPKLITQQYVRREAEAAWDCLQAECRRLLQELLRAPQLQASTISAAYQSSAGWLRGASEGSGSLPTASGTHTFSFDVQVSGMAPQQVLDRMQSMAPMRPTETMAQQALGGQTGGTYLAPALYRPVVQFVDGARRALEAAEGESDQPGTPSSKERKASAKVLRSFLETFISEEFLPEVYVNFRGRVSEVLQHAEAFRARARTRSVYVTEGESRPVLPVARSTEGMVEELLGWASQMPLFASHLTGVVENVLGQVLDAFQSRLTGLMGRCACRGLADNPQLAALMAKEPSALQAGKPVAFFVSKNGASDGIDAYVASVLNAGFGTGGDAAQIEVLTKIAQERPVRADALLASTDKVTSLAALADSADYLADVISRSGAVDVSGGVGPRSASPTKSGGARGKDGQPGGALTVGMAHLMDRYRALAGHALRALRLDLMLVVLHHLQELPGNNWACKEEDAVEVDECAGALIRAVSRAEEDLAPCLPPKKRAYLFGSLGFAAARTIMWLLPELGGINQYGVSRMCRLLAVLQPALSSLGAAGGAFRPESARAFEKARAYYGLLTVPTDALLRAAAERPTRFTAAEYTAMLQVNYSERTVTPEQLAQMAKTVGTKEIRNSLSGLFASVTSMPMPNKNLLGS